MMRRDAEGWRRVGPVEFRVEREDYPNDRSSRTNVEVALNARNPDRGRLWSLDVSLSRPWREQLEGDDDDS